MSQITQLAMAPQLDRLVVAPGLDQIHKKLTEKHAQDELEYKREVIKSKLSSIVEKKKVVNYESKILPTGQVKQTRLFKIRAYFDRKTKVIKRALNLEKRNGLPALENKKDPNAYDFDIVKEKNKFVETTMCPTNIASNNRFNVLLDQLELMEAQAHIGYKEHTIETISKTNRENDAITTNSSSNKKIKIVLGEKSRSETDLTTNDNAKRNNVSKKNFVSKKRTDLDKDLDNTTTLSKDYNDDLTLDQIDRKLMTLTRDLGATEAECTTTKEVKNLNKSEDVAHTTTFIKSKSLQDVSLASHEDSEHVIQAAEIKKLNKIFKLSKTNLNKTDEENSGKQNKIVHNNTYDKLNKVKVVKQVQFTKTDQEVTLTDINNFNAKVEEYFPDLLGKIPVKENTMYDLAALKRNVIVPEKRLVDGVPNTIDKESVELIRTVEAGTSMSKEGAVLALQQSDETDLDKEFDILNKNQEFFKIPSRTKINAIFKNKKYFKAHSELLNYLRCKNFLKYRDVSFMQQLVHQANIWMLKAGYSMDHAAHYTIMSHAVTLAFLVSEEELMFRTVIKSEANFDNIKHLNSTLKGDLGKRKIHLFTGEESFGRSFLPSYTLPSSDIKV